MAANSLAKLGFGVITNSQAGYLNGSVLSTNTAASLPATPTVVTLGARGGSGSLFWNGPISRVALWPNNRISNSALQAVTK